MTCSSMYPQNVQDCTIQNAKCADLYRDISRFFRYAKHKFKAFRVPAQKDLKEEISMKKVLARCLVLALALCLVCSSCFAEAGYEAIKEYLNNSSAGEGISGDKV